MGGELVVDVISFQKIFGLCGLKCHIMEIWTDVTLDDTRTDNGQRTTECEDRARILETEFAKTVLSQQLLEQSDRRSQQRTWWQNFFIDNHHFGFSISTYLGVCSPASLSNEAENLSMTVHHGRGGSDSKKIFHQKF